MEICRPLFECRSSDGPCSFGQAPSPCPAGIERSGASADPPFRLAGHPVNRSLQESPKVLNWAGLGDNGGFDSGAAS